MRKSVWNVHWLDRFKQASSENTLHTVQYCVCSSWPLRVAQRGLRYYCLVLNVPTMLHDSSRFSFFLFFIFFIKKLLLSLYHLSPSEFSLVLTLFSPSFIFFLVLPFWLSNNDAEHFAFYSHCWLKEHSDQQKDEPHCRRANLALVC